MIVNYNVNIKDMFQEYGSDKDVLFSKDYGGESIINAGNKPRMPPSDSLLAQTHLFHHCWTELLFAIRPDLCTSRHCPISDEHSPTGLCAQ